MNDRDCNNCIRCTPDRGCTSWDCDYINRKEAIEIWRANKDIVRCKDCKHYDTESRTFPCCTDIFGAVRYMEADGFCSKGERKGERYALVIRARRSMENSNVYDASVQILHKRIIWELKRK